MGIQINTQPQVFNSLNSTSVSAQNLTAIRGTFTTSVSSPAISAGKFTGDGSGLTGVVGVAAGVTSINGLTGIVTNVITTSGAVFTGNVTSPSVSATAISAAKFTGDGSGLTGIAGVGSGVTSINGLTGIVTNIVTTSGATLTGNLLAPSVSATSISAVNYLSGGINFTNIFATKSSSDNTYNIVSVNSADWSIGKTLSSSGGTLGGNTRVIGNLSANYITALSGSTFVNTVFTTTSALCVVAAPLNSGPALYVAANGSGDIASFYDLDRNVEVLHIGGDDGTFPNIGIKTSNPTKTLTVSGEISAFGDVWFNNVISNNDLTAKRATFTTSVSSPAISAGKFTGDGSGLTGVVGVAAGVTSINGLTGVVTNVVTTSGATLTGNLLAPSVSAVAISGTHYGSGANLTGITITNLNNVSGGNIAGTTGLNLSAASLTAVNGTFTTSISSPAISGTYFGSGANLTGITVTNLNGVSGGNIVGTTGLNLSAASLTAVRGTFTTSISSPAISGTYFGSGANLTGITITNLNGVSGGNIVGTTGLNLSAASLTAVNGTFTTSISSPALSSNTLTISGYPITPVTTVYSVANGATSTYTLALSDNNNTLTLNLGTSGVVQILSSITYPVGFQTNVIQLSTGRVTLSAGSGITLRNDLSSYRTLQQYSAATLINLGSVWVCYGSLSS